MVFTLPLSIQAPLFDGEGDDVNSHQLFLSRPPSLSRSLSLCHSLSIVDYSVALASLAV